MAMVVFPEPPFGLITSVVFIFFCYSNDLLLEHDATSKDEWQVLREFVLAEAGARGGDVADDAQARTRSAGHGSNGGAHWRHRRQAVDPLDDRLELLALGGGDGEIHLEDADAGLRG